MARAVAQSINRFDLAQPCDHAEIIRLQRDNPMPGRIRLSLISQPQVNDQVVVGRRPAGGLYGMGVRTIRPMYFNGKLQPVGYLGGLRLDTDHRGNPRAILGGYELFRKLHEADGCTRIYLTSVLTANLPARRFLEANLRGMPTYQFIGDFVTLVMPVPRRVRNLQTSDDASYVLSTVQQYLQDHQFASHIEPSAHPYRAIHGACGFLCDRSAVKQTIVQSYSQSLRIVRPIANLLAKLRDAPLLPGIGDVLKLAYVASLVTPSRETTIEIIESIRRDASASGFCYLVAGFPANHFAVDAVRERFAARVVNSRLYAVYWPDGREIAESMDQRTPWPEVSLL